MRCWLLLACHLQVDERGQALPFKTVSLLLDGSESHDSFCVHSHTHAHISLIFRVVELLIYMEITSEWFPSLTQGEITEKCTCTHCWWFSLPRKCFCRFLGSFAWRARTMCNSSPGKLREMSIMEKKKIENIKEKNYVWFWNFLVGITFWTLFMHYLRVTSSTCLSMLRKTPKTGALERSRTSEFFKKHAENNSDFFFCSKTHKNMYTRMLAVIHIHKCKKNCFHLFSNF